MKASELMIGDLVKTNKGDIIKVESISTKRQHRKAGYHTKDDTTHIKYVRQGQIEPIPLTEEILKANGFVTLGDTPRHEWYEWKLDGESFYITFYGGDDDVRGEIEVAGYFYSYNYVHELQHALRLCGLNNLADNFKIATTPP